MTSEELKIDLLRYGLGKDISELLGCYLAFSVVAAGQSNERCSVRGRLDESVPGREKH